MARVAWFANTSANDRGYPEPPPGPEGTPAPDQITAARAAKDPARPRDFQVGGGGWGGGYRRCSLVLSVPH